jgi:hypothetical protein
MPCTFKALEFACNGNGYLALESLAATAYPCPNCNTIAYLEKSFRASRDRQRETAACVCCGPGLSYDAIWSMAVKTARACSRGIADETIERLKKARGQ